MPNKHRPPHHPTPPPRALMRLSATHSPLPFPIPLPPLFSIFLFSFPFSIFPSPFFPSLLFSFLFSVLLFPLFSEIQFFPFSSFPFFPFFSLSRAFISRLPFPRFLPRVPLPLTRACAFIILYYCPSSPFHPAPVLSPPFFALRAPNSRPSQPLFAFLQPESNFFRMFFQKTSANIWWNGKVGVPLHPQTRKGHPCGAGVVAYARSASLVCTKRSLKD